jgi:pyridoxine 5-phosphate synthase
MNPNLGVNIDHVATVRNARGTTYPDPLLAASISLESGAHGITAHLREDRRHMMDHDIYALRKLIQGKKFNLEMALTEEMVTIAYKAKPDYVCLVPERRQERTTERGLSLEEIKAKRHMIQELQKRGIKCSLFISPNHQAIRDLQKWVTPEAIELHTGDYAHAYIESGALEEIKILEACGMTIKEMGIECHAGHGLNLENLEPLCSLLLFEEYNIGHALVAQSIFDSLSVVVKKYLKILNHYPIF